MSLTPSNTWFEEVLLRLTETKLDDSVPLEKSMLKGYGYPYRLDKNSNGGGLSLYVHGDIAPRS